MSGCNRELWRRLGHNEGERFLRTAMSSARKSRPDKTASKLVSLHLPGAGLRQLPAGDAVNMASGWLQQGNLPAVIQVMQALTQQLPACEPAWLRLFDALNQAGDFPALQRATSGCLSHRPRFVPALVSLSVACRFLQRYPQALEAIRKAVKLEPANAEVLNHLGVILKEMGAQDEALAAFNRCLVLRPDLAAAVWNRADLCGALAEAEYQRFQVLTGDTSRSLRQRAMLHYALARSDEQSGRYDAEFEHIRQGAELMRQTLRYDHAAELQQIDSIRDHFDTDSGELAEPGGGPVPVFICGLPRSGTTLVEQILSAHPQVTAGDELNDLPLACSQFLRRRGINKSFPEWAGALMASDWQSLGKAYLASTSALQKTTFFTDKNLQNYKAIGVIRRVLPQARIIVCRREPMDNLWGCLRQYFSDGLAFTYDQQQLAEIWQASNRLINYWKATGVPLLEVSHEALLQNPEEQTRRLLSYLGLPWHDACLSFYENKRAVRTTSATQVRQPLSDQAVGRWRRYEEHLQPMYEALQQTEEV
ncbi:MAG: hypothetical protein CMI00_03215 [Oceanospirillaceae bacterium]|nr:hypothetical protein [Oceanospirillaceae bacterium]|tara:strand:+ start:78064 stop:79668 length:1605 start_codon:yes stop_codon:yes gene_type:complete